MYKKKLRVFFSSFVLKIFAGCSPYMDVPWDGSMTSGMTPPGTDWKDIGMGVFTGLWRNSPPFGDLCLHCIEGMVAELLSGSGRLLPEAPVSVLLAPWVVCSGKKVVTESCVFWYSRTGSRVWLGCMPPISKAEISMDAGESCLWAKSSSIKLFIRRWTCSRFTSLSCEREGRKIHSQSQDMTKKSLQSVCLLVHQLALPPKCMPFAAWASIAESTWGYLYHLEDRI